MSDERWCWYEVDEDFVVTEIYETAEKAKAAAADHFDEDWDDDEHARPKRTVVVTRCEEVSGVARAGVPAEGGEEA
jgi:hypothetical protein